MKRSIFLCVPVFLVVSACGGGSSSSEPSGVVYSGGQSFTFNAAGLSEPSGPVPFRMVVSDNNIFITDTADDPLEASGTLSGENFTATSSSSGTEDGITCTFNLTYTGKISGNTASGTITGNVPCTDGSFPITFTLSNGTFTSTTGNAKTLVTTGESIFKRVSQLIK